MKPLKYYEAKQRGSMDFPLDYHYLDSTHPRYQMPCHWHGEYEILRVLDGAFELTLDGATTTLHAGEVAFINAESLHGGFPRDCVYECVVFDMRLLLKCNDHCKPLIGRFLHQQLVPQPCYAADDPIIRHTMPPMFQALNEQSAGCELITLGCLFQFLGEVYSRGAYSAPSPSQGEGKKVLQLKQVFEQIERDYASSLTLEDMASAAHMSRKYFCRFFRETTHRTPVDYLNYYRVEVACSEMVATEKTLTEIALDAGFSSLNYFIRVFRRYKGVSPGQYLGTIRA